jgi:hypothetical protein
MYCQHAGMTQVLCEHADLEAWRRGQSCDQLSSSGALFRAKNVAIYRAPRVRWIDRRVPLHACIRAQGVGNALKVIISIVVAPPDGEEEQRGADQRAPRLDARMLAESAEVG